MIFRYMALKMIKSRKPFAAFGRVLASLDRTPVAETRASGLSVSGFAVPIKVLRRRKS